jgi:hypothetical protein
MGSKTLYLNAECYNMLKVTGLIVDDKFIGFTDGKGKLHPVLVKLTANSKLPDGVAMQLK